jgi:signal transduction histidine kinase
VSARLSFRVRVMLGAALWTVGLLTVTSVVGITLLLQHPVQHAFMLHLFFMHPRPSLAVAAVSMVLGFWQVRKGLSSLDELRARLSDVREGLDGRVDGHYPSEVQPLVDDLNALLEHRDQAVARALAKAGDLAHGLKTPLAVLSREAERVDTTGHPELAAAIAHQVERMRRQVDYHLAQARAAAGRAPGARCVVLDSVDGLVRTLARLHADRGLAIDVRVARGHVVRAQREDVDEMLGNLLDNACKWARRDVRVQSTENGDAVEILVEDDGPGVEESMRASVLRRGVRADEQAPGSGLGLAIVRDLAELYGGSIALDRAAAGGVRARLRLPSA